MLKQLIYVNFHPFDGFYQTRLQKKGKYIIATTLLVLYGLLQIISYQYTGFIMNNNPIFRMNSIRIFVLALFPIILFVVSNWSVTTIFEGSGSIGDIYVVVCYSLFPKIIFDLIGVILSNFIIYEEMPILIAFVSIGTVWFCFLVFSGLCVIHEYTVFTNILMIISTFVAAIIIIFLTMLYLTIMSKMVNFIITVVNEFFRRW
ncbi:MAG: YIP1 family protein [Firmicutes bacterium]|nr:YIP1 family protein [Bacillota bacterium]